MNSFLITKPFWYLRHGQTDWNAKNLMQGRTDIPLNDIGVRQAKEAGIKLRELVSCAGYQIDRIISSPLGRAEETARIVAAILAEKGYPLRISFDINLIEMSHGELEGTPFTDWYMEWINGNFVPKQGESFCEVKKRSVAAVNRALVEGGVPLFVGHGGVFRALRVAMNLPGTVRLLNCVPVSLSPPRQKGALWDIQIF